MTQSVTGYHGTSENLARQILKQGFPISKKPGEWLGHGIYFWQESLTWAKEWAESKKEWLGLSGPIAIFDFEGSY